MSGWGLSPVAWQGWVATAVFLGLFIAAAALLPGMAGRVVAWVVLLAAFGTLLLLTSTRPGGPGLGPRE